MSNLNTKKALSSLAIEKFGRYSVNEFIKKALRVAVDRPNFFFDVLTGVVDTFYDETFSDPSLLVDLRKLKVSYV